MSDHDQGYDIAEEEYPKRGRRVPNLIGFLERDEEGWVWLSFETEEATEKFRSADNDNKK